MFPRKFFRKYFNTEIFPPLGGWLAALRGKCRGKRFFPESRSRVREEEKNGGGERLPFLSLSSIHFDRNNSLGVHLRGSEALRGGKVGLKDRFSILKARIYSTGAWEIPKGRNFLPFKTEFRNISF